MLRGRPLIIGLGPVVFEVVKIPIDPVAKQRPRKGSSGHFYTPEKTRRYEDDLCRFMIASRHNHKGPFPLSGPLGIATLIRFPILKAGKNRPTTGDLHTAKPDIDNLTKAVMDALQTAGIIKNDSQFAYNMAIKIWSNDPAVSFRIFQGGTYNAET